MNNKVFLLFILICRSNDLYSSEYEFNPRMLGFLESQNIDLTKFENKNYIYPGKYSMSLYVNNKFYKTDVNFNVADKDGKTIICLNKNVANLIPFNEKSEKNCHLMNKGVWIYQVF